MLFIILADVLPAQRAFKAKGSFDMNVRSFASVTANRAGTGVVEGKHVATAARMAAHLGNQIDAAFIFARADFVNVCGWLHRTVRCF